MALASVREVADEIVRRDLGVLALDTCAVLDVIRTVHREGLQSDLPKACNALASAASGPSPSITVVMASMVASETSKHRENTRIESEREIRKLYKAVARVDAVARSFRLPPLGGGGELSIEALTRRLDERVAQLVASSLVVSAGDDSYRRAGLRVTTGRAPAARGKQEFTDCLITEVYLELAGELRAQGFSGNLVFVSSNSSDFGGEGVRLREELKADFAKDDVTFACNLASAASKLGINL